MRRVRDLCAPQGLWHCVLSTPDRLGGRPTPCCPSARHCPLVLLFLGPWRAMDLLGGYGSGSDSEPESPSAGGGQGRVTLLANSAPEPQAAPAARQQDADPSRLLTSLPAPSGSKVSAAAAAAVAACRRLRTCFPNAAALHIIQLVCMRLCTGHHSTRHLAAWPDIAHPLPLLGRHRCSRACPSRQPRSGWRCSSACPSATTPLM